jgi:ubiquinone/menaquinone biosynthesis C-methylase UbiE
MADGLVDLVYASHCVEHLFSHEVPVAMKEFCRVLKPGGTVQIFVPDLSHVAKAVFLGNLDSAPLYESPAGPIFAVDVLFGLRSAVASGNEYYAHKTGFTMESLKAKLQEAGFSEVRVHNTDDWGLAATGVKSA